MLSGGYDLGFDCDVGDLVLSRARRALERATKPAGGSPPRSNSQPSPKTSKRIFAIGGSVIVLICLCLFVVGLLANGGNPALTATPTATLAATPSASPALAATPTSITPTSSPAPSITTAPLSSPAPSITPASAPCNCTGPDQNCSDFETHIEAQACFDYCVLKGYGDIFRLDRDEDDLTEKLLRLFNKV